MKLEKGKTISHYKILSEIGKGGMGEVYLAEDTKLDRKVAIKFLSEEFRRDPDKLNRFVQEAKAASALNHPNIITIHEIDEADGAQYIALEYIEGETLTERLKNKLRFDEALNIATQIASALDAAHSAGIVHRDIKPDNVMIRKDGIVKILDFGIAKLLGGLGDSVTGRRGDAKPTAAGEDDNTLIAASPRPQVPVSPKTTPGMIIGTANYMSPEQAKGKEVDSRTDIFSFGVLLYQMISGDLPFQGESPLEIIGSILKDEPKPIANLDKPPELVRLVSKCLRKEPDERYQTIKGLLADLKAFKREIEFQDNLERTVQPDRVELETKVFQATTAAEAQKTNDQTKNESISIKRSILGKVFAGFAVMLVLSATGIGYWYYSSTTNEDQVDSIAVMPFENRSGDADTDYLSDGLADSLIYRLSQLPGLQVSPTSSVMRYKGEETNVGKIARELKVDAVMSGRLVQRGDDLSISVQLIDARNEKLIWAEQYNRKMSDLMATQREIATTIAQKLRLKLAGSDTKGITKKYTDSNEAYQLYMRGRYYFAKRTKDDMLKSIDYFQQAIRLDANFALAYARIAEAYNQLPAYPYLPPKEAFPKAKTAAERAREIDPTLSEAHAALANTRAVFEWDWTGAEREFRRAIELDPNNASAHFRFGQVYLGPLGRHDEAIAEMKRGLEIE
ncbi:MAG: protein kinase, partial [Pyrinomonadaceae bacterium]|nr:protein kinase [Pyrinomonadaceae bacterium]